LPLLSTGAPPLPHCCRAFFNAGHKWPLLCCSGGLNPISLAANGLRAEEKRGRSSWRPLAAGRSLENGRNVTDAGCSPQQACFPMQNNTTQQVNHRLRSAGAQTILIGPKLDCFCTGRVRVTPAAGTRAGGLFGRRLFGFGLV